MGLLSLRLAYLFKPSSTQVLEGVVRICNFLEPMYHSLSNLFRLKCMPLQTCLMRRKWLTYQNPTIRTCSHLFSSSNTFSGSLFFIRQAVDNVVAPESFLYLIFLYFSSYFLGRDSNVLNK